MLFRDRAVVLLIAAASIAGCAQTSSPRTGPRQASQPTERSRPPALKTTDVAPTFKLASLDGKTTVDLASFRGDKPCLLFFGSYT